MIDLNGLQQAQTPDFFWIGCLEHSVKTSEIRELAGGNVIFHPNVANLFVPLDIMSLSSLQFAIEVLKVKNIVVCGHYGCSGLKIALENYQFDFLSNWLRPIARIREKYKFLLDEISEDQVLFADALCELNVIEQAASMAKISIVQKAWAKRENLSVSGLIYDGKNNLNSETLIKISENDEIDTAYDKAIADFKERWCTAALS